MSGLYLSVVFSFVVMQVTVEWSNSLIRTNAETLSSVMKKTGVVTVCVTVVASSNMFVDKICQFQAKDQSYFLMKDFISCFLIYVAMPTSLVVRNSSLPRNLDRWIASKSFVESLVELRKSLLESRNSVHPGS